MNTTAAKYRIARNNLLELLKNKDMFAAAYLDKQLRALAVTVIAQGV